MINWFKKSDNPLLQAYIASERTGFGSRTLFNELRFVAIDVETSGLDVEKDHILSIACFEIEHGQINLVNGRKWIVYQPAAVPTPATAIHGILPCETRAGTSEKEVLEELIPILTGAIVVGHHVRFDLAMIHAAMMRHYNQKCLNLTLDTARIAMHELTAFHPTGYANQRPPSLDEVCAQLNLPVVSRHTAEGDAFTTAEVFLLLCGRIRRRLKNRPFQLRDLPTRRFQPCSSATSCAFVNKNQPLRL
ncbi:MAG: 3'-5' exonuclease [Kiritimatiellaceae bacterium]|nr:3'-5' exonuclease [Kiritimatiellaceae bacterium]